MKDRLVWRSRWAAIGAAVAVSLGGGGMFLANAAPGPAESTIVNVTPTRVLDTRDPVNLGLPGPFTSPTSQKLQITGNVPTSGGNAVVVPVGATGVLLNVTAVSPQAAGFVSIRPGNAVGAPTTSSLNVEANSNIPNAVQVSLPTSGADAGKIDITYDAYGVAGRTTELLVDIVGYTTNTGLQELVADVALKANAADVYTKAQVDGLTLYATVAANGALNAARSDGATSVNKLGTGSYTVVFGTTNVTSCVFTATPSNAINAPENIQLGVQGNAAGTNGVFVQTANAAGTATVDSGFVLLVTCPPGGAPDVPADAPVGELESDLYGQGE